jgi:arylsulfatase A
MLKKRFIFFCCIAACLSCGSAKNTSPIKSQYNIIVILVDDVGRNDLGCYGNRFIETPHLDAMAAEGMRFINGYAAAPLCSPSRASLITGNNPARINLTEHLHGYAPPGPHQKLITPKIESALPPQLVTIPEALKAAGYTSAHFGKWHLGGGPSLPAQRGFDFSYGGGIQGLPDNFFRPFFRGQPYPDLLADTKEGDYIDDALTAKAIDFIGKQSTPFFVELNLYAAHVPIQGKPQLVKKYAEKRRRTDFKGLPEDEYAAMVQSIDDNVGRILDFLKQKKLDNNTVVIFTSDNGGLNVQEVPAFAKFTPPTTNAPLRGGKGYVYEGGIKEPWIVWGPSFIKKGSVNESVITTDDVFNTCMDLAGLANRSADGETLLPLLKNEKQQRDYFLHFPHYSPQRGKPAAVIRRGNNKLIEWYEDGKLELFDLADDPGETKNIAPENAATVEELKAALDAWRKNIGAKMPLPNPAYKGQQ